MPSPNQSVRAGFSPERELAAPFTGVAQTVGLPVDENPVIIIFDNQSTVAVEISVDGTNSWKTFEAGEALVLDLRANHGMATNFSIDIGTQFYAIGSGGTGAFFISILYAR